MYPMDRTIPPINATILVPNLIASAFVNEPTKYKLFQVELSAIKQIYPFYL